MGQVSATRGTAQMASVFSDWLDEAVATHEAEIAEAGGFLAIHDWRQLTGYDSEARRIWLGRMEERAKRHPGYLRKAVVIIAENPLLRMAIAGGNLVATLASRGKSQVEIATNVITVLAKYQVRPPLR